MWKYKYLNSDSSADSNTNDLNNSTFQNNKKTHTHIEIIIVMFEDGRFYFSGYA